MEIESLDSIVSTEDLEAISYNDLAKLTDDFSENKVRRLLVSIGDHAGTDCIEKQSHALAIVRTAYDNTPHQERERDLFFIPVYFLRFEHMLSEGQRIRMITKSDEDVAHDKGTLPNALSEHLEGLARFGAQVMETIADRDLVIANLAEKLLRYQSREDLIAQREADLTKREEKVTEREKHCAYGESTIKEKEKEFRKKETLLSRREKKCASSEQTIAMIKEESKSKVAELEVLSKNLADSNSEIKKYIGKLCQSLQDLVSEYSGDTVRVNADGLLDVKSFCTLIKQIIDKAKIDSHDNEKYIEVSKIANGVVDRARHFDSKDALHKFILEIGDVLRGTPWDGRYNEIRSAAFAAFERGESAVSYTIGHLDTLAPNASTVTNNHYKDNNGQG